jgi:hypothetical protein
MEESKQFSRLVKPVQRQLFWLLLWKEGQLFLLGAAVWAVVLYLLARILVFPLVVHFLFIGWLILGMINVYRIWRKRPSMREASLLFNQYVPEDRVITALSFLQQEGEMERLQLRDAVRRMKIHEQDVWKRKKKVFYPTWLVAAVLFGGAAMLSALFPNEAMLEAKKEEKVAKIMDEAEQELKQKAKETKDPAAEKALQEAKKKLAEVNNPEKALTELEKITKQLDLQVMKQKEKQQQLEEWQQQANNAGLHDVAKLLEQKDLEKLEQELKRLNQDWDQLTNKQREALTQLTEQQGQLTEEQLQALVAQLKTALQSGELSKQLAQASGQIQQVGQQVQKQLNDNGMPTKLGVSSGNNQNPSSLTPNPSSNQKSNQGQGSGQNGLSGQGGSGTGTGSSPGTGTGFGAGNGQGAGQGGTSGGFGQGSREMLTIPEVTEGQENREVDSGELGEGSSQQQTAEDAPVLKGSLRNYEEVYEQYGESYRESTERLRLPADLTNIVKEYYEQLAPER